jgi:hypothetical protein
MGMPLRITFRDRDYSFQVVNEEPITKETTEIPIILNGESLKLTKGSMGWNTKAAVTGIDAELIQAIGRAIELRFRL